MVFSVGSPSIPRIRFLASDIYSLGKTIKPPPCYFVQKLRRFRHHSTSPLDSGFPLKSLSRKTYPFSSIYRISPYPRTLKIFKVSAESNMSTNSTNTEVEIKLRLLSKDSHDKLFQLLKEDWETTHNQSNFFFDGSNKELSSNRVVLRLRFYNGDEKCIVTVKGNTVLENGISRTSEEEEEIDVSKGKEALNNPNAIFELSSTLVNALIEKYNVKSFVGLGGFKNIRNVFSWKSHKLKLELDETQFDFGTQYEIECETSEPEVLKLELETLLTKNGISYEYSTKSKFGIFRSGKLT